jgi:hypothetical protein
MRKQKLTSPDSRSFTPGRRYPGLHGKVVDWVEHKFEEGLLYLHVRFTDSLLGSRGRHCYAITRSESS